MSITKIINDIHLNTNSTFGANNFGPSPGSPLTPSVNFSSAYAFQSTEKLAEYHTNPQLHVRYARDSSAISIQCENYLSIICEKNYGFLFNSGMSAVCAGLHVLSKDVECIVTFGVFYRKTENVINILCDQQHKTHVNLLNIEDLDDVINQNSQNKVLLVIENFSNPFLDVIDIKEIRDKYPEIKILLDFTMQGLANSNQLKYSDITVTSCTKYIGGHNDVIAGAAFTDSASLATALWEFRSSHGGIVDPFSAYLLLRSLRTYDMRLKTQLANTELVLNYLQSKRSLVSSIFYPFYHQNYHNNNLKDDFSHCGSVVTFHVAREVNVKEKIATLKSMKMAPSFGSVDTLIEIPKYMSKRSVPAEHTASHDNSPNYLNLLYDSGLVRLSLGCEPISYILEDLDRIFN